MTDFELPPHGHTVTSAQLRAITDAVSKAERQDAAVLAVTLSAIEPSLSLIDKPVAAEFMVWPTDSGGHSWNETVIVDSEGVILVHRSNRDAESSLAAS